VVDVACHEKKADFPKRIEQQMQECAEKRNPTDSHTQSDDAEVFNARIGQHPFVVPAAPHVDGDDAEREKAGEDQQPLRKRPLIGWSDDLVEPQQHQHGGAAHRTGHERGDWRGRIGRGVDVARMHGRETNLGAQSDEGENEAGLEPERIELRRGFSHATDDKSGVIDNTARGKAEKQDADEQENQPERDEEKIFPDGFERFLRAIEIHERHEAERRQFQDDP
jgi:hypothetical protein